MEVEYQRRELIALQERVKGAEYSDDLPIHIWARAAKVLDKVADDRKELLRWWNDKRVQETHEDCYFCGTSVQVDTTPPPETKIVFTDNHAVDCELARELA